MAEGEIIVPASIAATILIGYLGAGLVFGVLFVCLGAARLDRVGAGVRNGPGSTFPRA